MSVITPYHCNNCREKHDLEQRKQVYDNLISKEEKKDKKDHELIRKLKRNRQEVLEDIEKIDREHEPMNEELGVL